MISKLLLDMFLILIYDIFDYKYLFCKEKIKIIKFYNYFVYIFV